MDLLDCPHCSKRFVVRNAGDGTGWICRSCHEELRLVARGLPGDLRRLSKALHANYLQPAGRLRASELTGSQFAAQGNGAAGRPG